MEDINTIAMQIILYAGDARLNNTEATKALLKGCFDEVSKLMKEAETNIVKAHQLQTDILQQSIAQAHEEYSILFSHAQDTLMTISSEINITKQLIKLYQSLNERIAQLETRTKENNPS